MVKGRHMLLRRSVLRISFVAIAEFFAARGIVAAQHPEVDVKVLCSPAMTAALTALAPEWQQVTGTRLAVSFDTAGGIAKRLRHGEAAEVAIVTTPAAELLVAEGLVLSDAATHEKVAKTSVGVATRQGFPRLDITSMRHFREVLRAAHAIAFPDPTSDDAAGAHFAEVMRRLQMEDVLRPKSVMAKQGANPGALLVSGEADLAIQMISELRAVDGVQVLGPLPNGIDSTMELTAAIIANADSPVLASRFIQYLKSPQAVRAIIDSGLELP